MSMQVRLWAILGEAQVGKSTVIGSLTSRAGRGRVGDAHIPLRGGGFLFVRAYKQSLQEANINETDFVSKVQKIRRGCNGCLNLLIALRTDSRVNGLPPAIDYLSHFASVGWSIQSLVILGYNGNRHFQYYNLGAPICEHENAPKWALEQGKSKLHWLMAPVRNHFNWA